MGREVECIQENKECKNLVGINKMKLEDIGFYTLENKRAKNVNTKSQLWRCELLLTTKCNFNCPYCRHNNKGDLKYEEAKKIIDLWSIEGLRNIRFSGGEPMLWSGLKRIVEYAKSKKIKRVGISTNGSSELDKYIELIYAGVDDFSISLDACCNGDMNIMTGTKDYFNTVINNIKAISKLVYTTVGVVINNTTIHKLKKTINFITSLGVSDIRIITTAQWNKKISLNIDTEYKILNYRLNNNNKGRNMRGIKYNDSYKCSLVLDDMAIDNGYHYPCIIYLREGGKPIGTVNENMRLKRYEWFRKHNTHMDSICNKNCLDVCIDYNNMVEKINAQTEE